MKSSYEGYAIYDDVRRADTVCDDITLNNGGTFYNHAYRKGACNM